MASCGTHFLFLTLICIVIAGCDCSFVSLKCNSDNHGRVGHQSLLDCTVSLSEEAQDAQIMEVVWMKEGAETPLMLLQYNAGGDQQLEPRFTFAEPHWKVTMNVSMLVTETKIADVGNYTCHVVTTSGERSTSTSLSVSAPYGTPTISSKIINTEKVAMTLSCSVSGGYPNGRIRWFGEHETDWTPSSKQHAIQTEDGSFNLNSKLDLLPGSIFSKYTCAVYNSSGGREQEAQYDVQLPGPTPKAEESKQAEADLSHKIVIPVVLIGAVIIGILMVFLLKQHCSSSYGVLPANRDYLKGGKPTGVLCGEPSAPLRRGGNHNANHTADPASLDAENNVDEDADHSTEPKEEPPLAEAPVAGGPPGRRNPPGGKSSLILG